MAGALDVAGESVADAFVVVGAAVVGAAVVGAAVVGAAVVGAPVVLVGARAAFVVVVVVGPESVLSPAHATVVRTNTVIKAARRVIDPWQHRPLRYRRCSAEALKTMSLTVLPWDCIGRTISP